MKTAQSMWLFFPVFSGFYSWLGLSITDVIRTQKDGYCRPMQVLFMQENHEWLPDSAWLPLNHWLIYMASFFTENMYSAGVLVSATFAGLSLVVFFQFASHWLSPVISGATTLLFATIWPFIDVASHPMTEPIFLFFILVSLNAVKKETWGLSGLALLFACLVRAEALVFVFAITLYILITQFKSRGDLRRLSPFLLSWLGVACFFLFSKVRHDGFFALFEMNHLIATAEKEFESKQAYDAITEALSHFPLGVYLALVSLALLRVFKRLESWHSLVLFLGVFLSALKIYSFSTQDLPNEPRYLLTGLAILTPIGMSRLNTMPLRTVLPLGTALILMLFSSFKSFHQYKNIHNWYGIQPEQSELLDQLKALPQQARLHFDIDNFDHCYYTLIANLRLPQNSPNKIDKYLSLYKQYQSTDTEELLAFNTHVVIEKNYSDLQGKIAKINNRKKRRFSFDKIWKNQRFEIYEIHPKHNKVNDGFHDH